MGVETKDDGTQMMTALVVPFICNPLTTQPINLSSEHHDHLLGLELADSPDASDLLEVDVLIGSDSHWSFITGRLIQVKADPQQFTQRLDGSFRDQPISKKLQLTSPLLPSMFAQRKLTWMTI